MDNSNQAPKEAQTPEVRNRKGLRVAIIVIILIIVAAAIGNSKWKASKSSDDAVLSDCKPGDLFSQSTGKPCPQTADTTTDTSADTATVSGYEAAIREYAGKVVVFDGACKPLPANPTFAPGTRILIANNAPKAATIAFADKTESLDGYHYFTYSLKTADVMVTCNGAPAVTISVKK